MADKPTSPDQHTGITTDKDLSDAIKEQVKDSGTTKSDIVKSIDIIGEEGDKLQPDLGKGNIDMAGGADAQRKRFIADKVKHAEKLRQEWLEANGLKDDQPVGTSKTLDNGDIVVVNAQGRWVLQDVEAIDIPDVDKHRSEMVKPNRSEIIPIHGAIQEIDDTKNN